MSKGKVYTKLINSSRWRHLRLEFLAMHPFCERCKQLYDRDTFATCVHHIEPAESAHNEAEIEALMFNIGNLQALCAQCHKDIHNEAGYHKRDAVKARKALRINDALSSMYGECTTGAGN